MLASKGVAELPEGRGNPFAAEKTAEADVVVVGGGSAGFAAAWNAARLGSSVVLVERADRLGGTSTIGGVSNWEPDCGATGTPRIVYERMHRKPNAAGVYVISRHHDWDDPKKGAFPGALCVIDSSLDYTRTLRRHGPGMGDRAWFRANCHGVIFEPQALADTMREMLDETGRCRTMLKTSFVSAEKDAQGNVLSLTLSDGTVVRPKIVIDACGAVCNAIGCRMMKSPRPNGVTLVYRVTSGGERCAEELAAQPECWWGDFPYAFCEKFPNGDICVNMLPTMTGEDAAARSPGNLYAECRRRVFAHWAWMKVQWPEFASWRIKEVCGEVACRETSRVEGEYVLTGADAVSGMRPTDEIAIADHALDSHGGRGFGGELKRPYGIPFRCLLPKGTANVMIVGRCASFDEVAASSCRLSRTMMQLGEAAGVAAHTAIARGIPLREVHPVQAPPCRRFPVKRELDLQARERHLQTMVAAATDCAERMIAFQEKQPNANICTAGWDCFGFASEMRGRAGGIANVGYEPETSDCVMLYAVRSWEDCRDRAPQLLQKWREEGKFIVLFASKSGMPDGLPSPDVFLDNGASDGSAEQGSVNVLANAVLGWMWACEYYSAWTRRGWYPLVWRTAGDDAFWRDFFLCSGPDRTPRLKPTDRRIEAGTLANCLLNRLEKRIYDLQQAQVSAALDRAAALCADALKAGRRVAVSGIGHLILEEMKVPGSSPMFGFRSAGSLFDVALKAAVGEGDVLVWLGYDGMDSWNVDYNSALSRLGAKLVVSSALPLDGSLRGGDYDVFIPQLWLKPDAEVAIPHWPWAIAPLSEIDRVLTLRMLDERIAGRLEGCKVPQSGWRDPWPMYDAGTETLDPCDLARVLPDDDDVWGEIDASGREIPCRKGIPSAKPVCRKMPRFGYAHWAEAGAGRLFVERNRLWGVVDGSGRLLVDVRYVMLKPHENGLIGEKPSGDCVTLDWDGRETGPFDPLSLSPLADLKKTGKQEAVTDEPPRFVPPGGFAYASKPVDGQYRVVKDGRWGVATADGRLVVPCDCTMILPRDGRGRYLICRGGTWRNDVSVFPYPYGGKWGAVDGSGREIVPCCHDGLRSNDKGGWTYVRRKRLTKLIQ